MKYNKIKFFLSYFYYKLIIPLEVKRPKFLLFVNELYYSFCRLLGINNFKLPFELLEIHTVFGRYNIRPNNYDCIWASPAFERLDINFLIQLLDKYKDKNVHFFDVGADFGTYSISIGNRFAGDNIMIHAFEPTFNSFCLLRENIALNKIENISIYNFGLFDVSGKSKIYHSAHDSGSSSLSNKFESGQDYEDIDLYTLDSLGLVSDDNSILFFKIDVEGYESNVIEGALNLILKSKISYFLVEDFIDQAICDKLISLGASFVCKLTPYNSFFVFKNKSTEAK